MKKTIAAHMLDIMEEEGINTVHLGVPAILEECCSRSGNPTLIKLEPRERHQRILNALEKSPFFKKTYVKRPDRPTVTTRGFCIH